MEFEIESIEEIDDALARNEAIIRRGLIDVGEAFTEIARGKMYRAKGYQTFETYCRGEWQKYGLGYEMIRKIRKASEIIQGIGTIVPISQMREGVIRETVPLPNNEIRAEVVKKVLATNPNPTAKDMRAAVEEKLIEILPETDPKVQKIKAKSDRSIKAAQRKFVKFWNEFTKEYFEIPRWQLDKMAIKAIQNR